MWIDTVQLAFVPGIDWARVHELRGSDEQAIDGSGTGDAIQLLDRLLVENPGPMLKPGQAATLTAADRDRLLVAIYCRTFGPRIVGTLTCSTCGKAFDLDFDLSALQAALQPHPAATPVETPGHCAFALNDGRRFRLPTGEDEMAVWHLPADDAIAELLRRCMPGGDATIDAQSLQTAMQSAAPLLDLEMDGQCPECGKHQAIHFDIQGYLLSALQTEQPRLTLEIHRLAVAYGWTLSEILRLPRSQRQAYVKLIEDESNGRPMP